jgi:hypothetical protein
MPVTRSCAYTLNEGLYDPLSLRQIWQKRFALQDIARAALVRGLTQVLLHGALTKIEKPRVVALLENEIQALVAAGVQNDVEIAKEAVARAVVTYRSSQKVRRPPRKYFTRAVRRLLDAGTIKERQAV